MILQISNVSALNNPPKQEIKEQSKEKEKLEETDMFSKMLHAEIERLQNAKSSTYRQTKI